MNRNIRDKYSMSPNGDWVLVHADASQAESVELDPSTQPDVNPVLAGPMFAASVHDGTLKRVCPAFCLADWSSDGRFFYVKFDRDTPISPGKVLAIPVPAGRSLPDLPPSGIDLFAGNVTLPGAKVIDSATLVTGPDPSTFVFTKTDLQRNLFRIPLR
jgi:hypothetical protein